MAERAAHEEERNKLQRGTTQAQQELLESRSEVRTLVSQNTDLQTQLQKSLLAVSASDTAAKEVQELTIKVGSLQVFCK